MVSKPGPLDVQSNRKQKESGQAYRRLRRALCTGYGNQLAERMIHHNGYRTLGYKSQLAQVNVPPSRLYRPLLAPSSPANTCIYQIKNCVFPENINIIHAEHA